MDNNPFRTSNSSQQQNASQQQPYNGHSGFHTAGMNQQGYTPNSYSWNNPALASFDPIHNNPNSLYQQQQQQQQQQHPPQQQPYHQTNGMNQYHSGQLPQNNHTLLPQQPGSFPATTNYLGQQQQQQPPSQYSPITSPNYLGQQQPNMVSMPSGYNMPSAFNNTQSQFGGMVQPQYPPQQQPQYRHAPVDAASLLSSREVRRVDCPVCHKTIEGDDPAINYHVNEHYS